MNYKDVVTTNQDINYSTVGRPFLMTPIEGKENGFRLNRGEQRTLSFKAPDDDIYIDRVCFTMWSIDGGNLLTFVDPDSETGSSSDVRIRIRDNNYLRELNDREIRWNLMAGDARNPAHWPGAKWIIGSGILNIELTNNEIATDYIIAITLVCRRVAGGYIGDEIREKLCRNPNIQMDEVKRIAKPLTNDPDYNIRHKGLPRCLSVNEDGILPSSFNAATYVAPDPVEPRRFVITTEPSYWYLIKNFVATTRDPQSATISAINTNEPLWVRIFSRKFNQWLTDEFVPFGHVFGDGNYPGYLPVEWVIDENDAVIVEMQSYAQTALDINFAVWGTYRTSPKHARGVYV